MGVYVSFTFSNAAYDPNFGYYIIADKTIPVTFTVTGGGESRGSSGDASFRTGSESVFVEGRGYLYGASSYYQFPSSGGPWSCRAYGKSTHDQPVSSSSVKIGHIPDNIPPTISGPTYPASEVSEASGQTYVKGSTVTVTYTGSDTGGSGFAGISIDGGSLQSSPASKTYTVTADFTSTAYAKDGAGNQSGSVSKAFKYDNIAPTINISLSAASTAHEVGPHETTEDTSAKIQIEIVDSMSGPKSFEYDIVLYTFDGTNLNEDSRTSHSHTGNQVDVPLDSDFITGVEVYNAQDVAGNPSSGRAISNKYEAIIEHPVTQVPVTPVALPTAGCNDFWEHGPPNYPSSGLVDMDDLKNSSKFLNWIASQYGMTVADVERCLGWVEWITDPQRKVDTPALHAGLGSIEGTIQKPPDIPDVNHVYAKNWFGPMFNHLSPKITTYHQGKTAFNVSGGSGLNGRSGGGGWYSGLYGRGQNGSSQYTACWLGTKGASSFLPQPVAEHLAHIGNYWGFSTWGGWATTKGGIRGGGTDMGGNQYNTHRRRDDFILWAIHGWNSGSKNPRHYGTHTGATESVGIDKWLQGAGLIPQGGGMYKIDDCIPPTIDDLRVKSTTVMAGNGKEYYTDYPNTGHVCHFEVEATDLEYGLKHAIFTPHIDSTGGGTFTAGSPSTPVVFAGNPQGTAIAEYTINTQGHKEVYCDVEVFDMADNSSTETMSAKVISIDDAEPLGGPSWTGSGATTSAGTNNIQTPGLRLENIPYMVGSKPYWNSKEVDIFIEYGDEYSGIDEAKLYINGNVELQTPTLPQTATAILHAQTHHISNGNLREGKNNCQLWLKDLATNEWWSQSLEFYIDMTDPDGYLEFSTQFQLRENNGKLWTKENDIDVDLFYGDPGPDASGINSGATGVGSVPSSHNVGLSGNQLLNHNQGGLSVGQNDIYFTVKDYVSWEEDGAGSGPMTSDKVTLYVDQTPPTGSIARNSGQLVNTVSSIEYANTTNFNIDLQHDDADSGLF